MSQSRAESTSGSSESKWWGREERGQQGKEGVEEDMEQEKLRKDRWNRDCLLEGSLRPKGKERVSRVTDLDSPLAPSRGSDAKNKFLDDDLCTREGGGDGSGEGRIDRARRSPIPVYTKPVNIKLAASCVGPSAQQGSGSGGKGLGGKEEKNVAVSPPKFEGEEAETPIDKMVKQKCRQVKDGLDLLE
eukprot:763637-Hanusia_phi.AAC.4